MRLCAEMKELLAKGLLRLGSNRSYCAIQQVLAETTGLWRRLYVSDRRVRGHELRI